LLNSLSNIIMVKCIYAVLFFACLQASAQDKGDEDKQMMNNGEVRDQKSIDEAKNSWWTASMKTHDQRIAWWKDAKFGMFIHWGIYSLPGGEWKGKKVSGYAEHLMRKEKITRAEYLALAHDFNPTKFNAEEWVKYAKNAGMNYLIITAKHHDGFAMYDSKVSDFNVVQRTKWKHDPMADLAAACKKYGIKFGFYYSHAFDWEHPDAPGNDWEYKNPGGDQNLFGGRDWYNVHPELLPKAVKYVDEKAIPQIKELLNKYHPDILWFDTPQKLPLSENIRILKAIRETDPNVVVNGRLARSSSLMMGDYLNTGDRPAEFRSTIGDWEAIPTTNESYGYSKYDDSHKPIKFFVQLLAKAASRGGNLLMNIGPMGDGSFDMKDINILKGLAAWIGKNKESIYQTTATPLPLQSFGVTTMNKDKLYLHVFDWPSNGLLSLGGIKTNISKAYFLTDPAKKNLRIEFLNASDISIQVGNSMPDTLNTVIVLETKGQLEADSVRLIASNMATRLLAFDGEIHGKGFGYGDGKSAGYYVDGWKSKEQSISWLFHTTEPQSFKVVIKYVATPETEGTYALDLDGKLLTGQVTSIEKGATIITKELGVYKMEVDSHILTITPTAITKAELMKILEIILIPIEKKQ